MRGKSIQRSICWDFQLVLGTKFEIIINNGDSEVQLWFSDANLRLGCQHTDLSEFSFRDIKKVKDSQKDFEKASSELDNAINRNAGVPRTKTQECEEAGTMLKAKKSCFAHTSVDHVFQVILQWQFLKVLFYEVL